MKTELQSISTKTMHIALSISDISRAANWGVKFALAHPDCIGRTMSEVACKLGFTSRAAISRYAVMLCEQTGLPASQYMKSEKARESARIARNKHIQKQ